MDKKIVKENLLLMNSDSKEKGGLKYLLSKDNVIWKRYYVEDFQTEVGMIYDYLNGKIERFCYAEDLNKDPRYREFAKAVINFYSQEDRIKISLEEVKDELYREAIINLGESFVRFKKKNHDLDLQSLVQKH